MIWDGEFICRSALRAGGYSLEGGPSLLVSLEGRDTLPQLLSSVTVFFLFVFVALTFLLPLLVERLLVNLIHLIKVSPLSVCVVCGPSSFCKIPQGGLTPGVALKRNNEPPAVRHFPPGGIAFRRKNDPLPGGTTS
ncbi:unnamed protein product [Ectocarpus sp. 12 AP-2014]